MTPAKKSKFDGSGRNPLKSGQCFLHIPRGWYISCWVQVAIPSNRVNVSYEELGAYIASKGKK